MLYKRVKGSKSHKGTVMGAPNSRGQEKQRVWNSACMEGRRSAVQPSFRPSRTTEATRVALRCYFLFPLERCQAAASEKAEKLKPGFSNCYRREPMLLG